MSQSSPAMFLLLLSDVLSDFVFSVYLLSLHHADWGGGILLAVVVVAAARPLGLQVQLVTAATAACHTLGQRGAMMAPNEPAMAPDQATLSGCPRERERNSWLGTL